MARHGVYGVFIGVSSTNRHIIGVFASLLDF